MVGVIDRIVSIYGNFRSGLSRSFVIGLDVFILALLVVIISVFIWKFYRSLSEKNLFVLDLNRHNKAEHPSMRKFFAVVFYFLEYLLLMPFIIMLWFAALAIILLLIVENVAIGKVLMITAAMVLGTRILAYNNKEIARDVAKMFPFIALSLFLLSPEVFDFGNVLGQLKNIPLLFSDLFSFLAVIYVVEIFFRLLFTLKTFMFGDESELGEKSSD